jgi:hypothetical protein
MVALTSNFHVVTSSGTTNISAVLFILSHITKARYVRTFFKLRTGHTALHAFQFIHRFRSSNFMAAIPRTALSAFTRATKPPLLVVIHECISFAIAEQSARHWN